MKKINNPSLKTSALSILLGVGLAISAPSWANEPINMTALFSNNSKQLKITQSGTTLYVAKALWSKEIFSLVVTTGHEKQQGKIIINNTAVQAFNQYEQLLWQDERVDQKVCLPELFGEFIRAHITRLKQGESINCVGPIIKAKKLAPFKVYLAQQSKNELLVNIGPGSIGMWFFMNEISIRMNADASEIIAYNGVSPAPQTLSGEMAYLNISTTLAKPLEVAKIDDSILW
jgi:hypothetical protein